MVGVSLISACEGRIFDALPGDGTSTGELNPCTDQVTIGSAPMRRLSHDEYRYSLTDVFGQPALTQAVQTQAQTFLPDSTSLGFRNGAAFLTVTPVLAQQYMDAAEQIASIATADLGALLPCSPAANEASCAGEFIRTFGRRLYRRALTADELAAYQAVYDSARSKGYDFQTGVEWLVFTFVQSPGFLYRLELDTAADPPVRQLTPTELASRLSFLLWQAGPDEALLSAAEQGQLATKADLDREARRLLADPRAQRSFTFFEQWLGLDGLSGLKRDPTQFPGLDPTLGGLLHDEAQAFVKGVVWDGDGTLSTLVTAPYTYVNGPLAAHYRYSGVTGSGFQQVAFPGRRAGLFMLGGVLAVRDRETRTSIVRRGLAVRTAYMCQPVGAPPPNVPALGPVDQNQSQTSRLAEHRSNPACAGCHSQLDPVGSPFEGIDAVGRDRTTDEGGRPVITQGSLTASGDPSLNGVVTDGLDLVTRLAQGPDVRNCFATQLYRFSMGRKEEDADACSRYRLRTRFKASGTDIRDLLVGLTQVDDFTLRRTTPP